MDFLVEFLESGARIIKDPILVEKKKDSPNVILNPDLSHLKGISPSFWVKEGNTIGTLHPNESLKQVMDSLSENHPFDLPGEAIFSSDSKFIQKIEEIDAKRENDLHNLMKAMAYDRKFLTTKIDEMDLKFTQIVANLDQQLLKKQKQLKVLSLMYIIGMILVKFL
jgi:hypothetical protein